MRKELTPSGDARVPQFPQILSTISPQAVGRGSANTYPTAAYLLLWILFGHDCVLIVLFGGVNICLKQTIRPACVHCEHRSFPADGAAASVHHARSALR